MKNKTLSVLVVIALIIGIGGYFFPMVRDYMGGLVHNARETFDEGIAIDGELVITGDGSIITRGKVYDFGESASTSITAQMICEGRDSIAYNFFTIDADGSGDDVGVSIAFSDDETITALRNCIEYQGDSLSFTIDPTSSTSTTYIDLTTTGLVFKWASLTYDRDGQIIDFNGGWLIDVDVENVNGTSLAWTFTPRFVSLSYQLP